ncbi:MAG: exonuclease SbcCD subunit D [Treponema sp.]|nr:exonuclease SbcCD subunit D [Treponema sp.]
MKLIHLADLHLGKNVNKFPMLEDQKYILDEILKMIEEEKPQVLMISGDIYDLGIPPIGAVELFDSFLTSLSKMNISVCIISGNHDSAERIAFGNKLMEKSNIFISQQYDGNITPLVFQDQYGPVNIYMLPFIKPIHVKAAFGQEAEDIHSYTEACDFAIKKMKVNPKERNILMAHQFVSGAQTCDSEEINVSVGGLDNVDASVFKDFDYVALGHLHGPQKVSREGIRYAGSPLKYSFSEANQKKSLCIIELGSKNEECQLKIDLKELHPLHDMKNLRGSYDQVMSKDFYKDLNLQDYYHITLTDEVDVPEGFSRLRTVYQNLMTMDYDNSRTQNNLSSDIQGPVNIENISPLAAFKDFFKLQNNKEMSEDQEKIVADLVEKLFEGEK